MQRPNYFEVGFFKNIIKNYNIVNFFLCNFFFHADIPLVKKITFCPLFSGNVYTVLKELLSVLYGHTTSIYHLVLFQMKRHYNYKTAHLRLLISVYKCSILDVKEPCGIITLTIYLHNIISVRKGI